MDKNTDITVQALADELRTSPDTLRKRIVRASAKYPDIFPDKSAALDRVLSAEQVRVLSGKQPAARPDKIAVVKESFTTEKTSVPKKPGVETPPARQVTTWPLYALAGLATLASTRNMYRVTAEISGSNTDAVLLTAVLSVSAIGFVISGSRQWWVMGLTALLIAFESFCNLSAIFGGLLNVGTAQYGYPTRFLGLVTDIFNTGTHGTAVAIAAFTAFFIAAVQYAAIFELNKK